MRCAPLLLAIGVLVAAGCEETREAPADSAAPENQRIQDSSSSEGRDLAWLSRLRRWERKFDRQVEEAALLLEGIRLERTSKRKMRRALRKIASCDQVLRERLGAPKASRYAPGFALVQKECRSRKRVAHLLLEAMDAGVAPSMPKLEVENARGDAFFEQARDSIEGALRANRSLPVARGSSKESRVEPRLSRAASELIWRQPHGVEVRCWSVREWPFVEKEWAAYVGSGDLLGFVHQKLDRISIAPVACALLARFVYRRDRPAEGVPLVKAAFYVGLLAHEAEHIVDYYQEETESTIECWGMQRIRWLARIMGANRSYADLLARTYWATVYPLNPPGYWTRGCRDGSRLDKHPGSDVWP